MAQRYDHDTEHGYAPLVSRADGRYVRYEDHEELLVTAQELLEELKEITHNYTRCVGMDTFSIVRARAVIAKVETRNMGSILVRTATYGGSS